jgi:hypothetical protein
LTDHSTTDGEGWFYTQGGQRKGPFSADELHKLLAARTIDGETPIWRKDQSGWQPLLHDRGRCAAQGYSAARRPRHLNNGFVWALAVAPIAYLFMHVASSIINPPISFSSDEDAAHGDVDHGG